MWLVGLWSGTGDGFDGGNGGRMERGGGDEVGVMMEGKGMEM